MQGEHVTTPFGRRPMTLALVRRHTAVAEISQGKSVNKWSVFRNVSEAMQSLGLKDRSLAVLDALLSFYPDNELCQDAQLVVFPSNAQLSLRAHGIAGATLRRHIALLVEAGVILRRDSANGKRYAHRGRGGEIETAYGFDLSPLLSRAEEFAVVAKRVVAERSALRRARESLTICRRDVRKLISVAKQEGVDGDWQTIEDIYQSLIETLSRSQSLDDITLILDGMSRLQSKIINVLKLHRDLDNSSTNDAHNEHHTQSSNTESHIESEAFAQRPACSPSIRQEPSHAPPNQALPLSLVLKACPDIAAYGPGGVIHSWNDLKKAAAVVRSMLGVTSATFDDACHVMGPENAAVALACILERGRFINSAGGYLRDLTRRAQIKQFSPGPMLMALARKSMTGGKSMDSVP
ncbi:plasmid replication protein RepC [Rhizobium grahamii]|uniref:Replication initiation protein RepC n=2 Tax=Rhizobium grahamii TaxID=1120045 RepID=S3HDJ9_9HYPH|nr:plasmid replication protein RepC [Rhizobium grahamii]EPE96922.1 replication initiation protein RepC [Rhizobium grahamii CCGE 502]RDJ03856.1 replication initiation protein RepC [Rhizobium grahamii]